MARPFDDDAAPRASNQTSDEAEQQRQLRLAERSCWCGMLHNTGERLTAFRQRPATFPPTRQQPAQLGVFVSQLPFDIPRIEVGDLLKTMLEAAELSPRSIRVFPDRENGSGHAGHAVVVMNSVSDAGTAIDALNGHEMFGRRDRRMVMRADFARPKVQDARR